MVGMAEKDLCGFRCIGLDALGVPGESAIGVRVRGDVDALDPNVEAEDDDRMRKDATGRVMRMFEDVESA